MLPKCDIREDEQECQCQSHLEFQQVMREIKKNGNYQECLQIADDLYGIKQYNVLDLKPKKIAQLYNSVCNRIYAKSTAEHQYCWVSYELKIFVWLVVCHLHKKLSNPQTLDSEIWEKYSKIFHNKNIQLIQYQAKLVSCGRCQPRKWEREEQELLASIIKPNQINSKWNEVAKALYLKSNKKYFRNPKQARQHWLNHLNPQISKDCWTVQEDIIIIETVLQKGRRWALAAKLGGSIRTQHMIKNRFFALLRNEQRNNPSIHDKQRILKLIHKKLLELKIQSHIALNQPQIRVQIQNQLDNCFSFQKLQNKSTTSYDEQQKSFIQQKPRNDPVDLIEIEYKQWSEGSKKDSQIELYQLGHYQDEQHHENYQIFFNE